MTDPFADLFRALRVRGAVYFAQDFSAPWGMALPQRPHVQFHVALAGSCVVDAPTGRLQLEAREVVLFPNGAAHAVSDGHSGTLRDGRSVVQAIRGGERPFRGEATDVRLLSGHFEFDRGSRHPLVRHLPDVVHVGTEGAFDAPLYDALAPLLSREAGSRRAGAETIVERLAEIFLVQVLRAHFAGAGRHDGLLSALFDPRLGAGVAVMHARWADPLTLRQIARSAGMSRSTFAAAFKHAAGLTPMAYLSQWRLLRGRDLLGDRTMSIAEVAVACGHQSTEGFSRAFRRLYGQSPTALRAALRPASDGATFRPPS